MYRLFTRVIPFLLVFLVSSFIFATENKQVVKIGYVANYGVIDEHFVAGYEGFGYEYFREISRYTNHFYEFVPVDYLYQCADLLEKGEIDIFGPVNYEKELIDTFEFTENLFALEETLLVTLTDSDFYSQNPQGLNGKKIGVLNKSEQIDILQSYLHENNISADIVYVDTMDSYNDLKLGLYDVRVTTNLSEMKGLKILDSLAMKPFYFMARKENANLIHEIDTAIKKIHSKDRLFSETIFVKYYINPASRNVAFSMDELKFLESEKLYKVGYNISHKPLCYRDSDGTPRGTAIDVMNEIASKIGLSIEYIPLGIDNDFSQEVDLNLNVIAYDSDHLDYVTNPYMDISLVAIFNKRAQNDTVNKIAMLNYNSIDSSIITNTFPGVKIIYAKSMDEVFNLLSSNQVEGVLVSSLVANAILGDDSLNDYSIQHIDVNVPFVISISKEIPLELQDILNKVINGLDFGFIQTIISTNLANFNVDKFSFRNFIYKYRTSFVLIIFILLVIFTIIVAFISKQKKNELDRIRNVDPLTGVMTTNKFFLEARKILKNAEPYEYVLCSIDIDNLKKINNHNGYEAGSNVIIQFSKKLIETFGPTALVAREINDVFIVLFKNIYVDFFGNLDEIYISNSKIDEYIDSFGNNLKHSISEGIFVIENPHEDISYMLDCAHTARLAGKHTFGLTINIFTDEMLKKQYTKNTIESLMESSLDNEEFFVVLQPKYNLITGKLVGSEALVRWQPEFGNIIYPDEFISIFEDNGFIKKIDFYVFEQVCKLLSNTEYNYPRISVNLSGVTATVDNVALIYKEILNNYKLDPSKIEIELTESAFVNNSKKIKKNIDDFKKYGFNLSIDDFGIGVSSLSRLKDMNVDELKLDKSFIGSNLLTDKGISIIKNIISLSKDLHLNVVAEGIETEEQLAILLNLGCDVGQGYYFAKPLNIKDFNLLVEKNHIIPTE